MTSDSAMSASTMTSAPSVPAALRGMAATLAAGGRYPELGLRLVPVTAQLNLRLDPASVTAAAVGEVIGHPLPTRPNTLHGELHETAVLWLGPTEWLIVTSSARLYPQLRELLAGAPHADQPSSLVDVSASRVIFAVSGQHARTVLSHGCSLDLHRGVFQAGDCAQSTLAQAQVVLASGGTDIFWVFVRPSFATHLADWLLDASLEYREAASPEYTL